MLLYYIVGNMSLSYSESEAEGYTCKICGRSFMKAQSLAAHIESEHPEAEQPEIF
jgi:Zinc finger, C2H2 type